MARTRQSSTGRREHFFQHPGKKGAEEAHPLTVHAIGGRHIFPRDRDAEDHVYCMFEFPGPAYEPEFPVGYEVASGTPDPKASRLRR